MLSAALPPPSSPLRAVFTTAARASNELASRRVAKSTLAPKRREMSTAKALIASESSPRSNRLAVAKASTGSTVSVATKARTASRRSSDVTSQRRGGAACLLSVLVSWLSTSANMPLTCGCCLISCITPPALMAAIVQTAGPLSAASSTLPRAASACDGSICNHNEVLTRSPAAIPYPAHGPHCTDSAGTPEAHRRCASVSRMALAAP